VDLVFGRGRGVGDHQPLKNIIITIVFHEHFSHGTSTFTGGSVLNYFDIVEEIIFQKIKVLILGETTIGSTNYLPQNQPQKNLQPLVPLFH
jgi:hypothetical protein